jgi:hypothetical protein
MSSETALRQQLRVMLEALSIATEELERAHQQLQHEYARGLADGLQAKGDKERSVRAGAGCGAPSAGVDLDG